MEGLLARFSGSLLAKNAKRCPRCVYGVLQTECLRWASVTIKERRNEYQVEDQKGTRKTDRTVQRGSWRRKRIRQITSRNTFKRKLTQDSIYHFVSLRPRGYCVTQWPGQSCPRGELPGEADSYSSTLGLTPDCHRIIIRIDTCIIVAWCSLTSHDGRKGGECKKWFFLCIWRTHNRSFGE